MNNEIITGLMILAALLAGICAGGWFSVNERHMRTCEALQPYIATSAEYSVDSLIFIHDYGCDWKELEQ